MSTPLVRSETYETVTIAQSGSTSSVVTANGRAIYGLVMPSTFTGTAITFTVSHDGSTFQELRKADSDAAVSVSVTASKSYDLPTQLAAWPYFKIVSNGNEAAARSLTVVKKG